MSSLETGPKTCPLKSGNETHPEQRSFPVVPTLIGVVVAMNVASVILTLIE
jgi:hypothetical protein